MGYVRRAFLVNMDIPFLILLLVILAAFCSVTLVLLLRMNRRQSQFQEGLGDEQNAGANGATDRMESLWRQEREEAKQREESLRNKLEQEGSKATALSNEVARLQAELGAANRALDEHQNQREAQEKLLLDRFKLLSNDLLASGTEKLKATSRQELDALLKPFGERLDAFGKQVREAYGEERKQQGELSEKLKQLFELNQKMTEEAHNLTQALTGNSKVQGDWGELQLETLLQNAGLDKDVHYEIQDTGRNDEGRLLRPDFLVRLPDQRSVIIDSKVSLTAYANWTAAEDKAVRDSAMKAHYGSLERHVRDLGEKGYQDLYGSTPDFVLMYIPVEPALSIDYDRQNALYQMAAGKKVVPVTTSTLLATLRLISFLWKQESQRRNAEAIAERGQLLLKKFNGFLGDMEKVGEKLNQAQAAHDGAVQKLFRGRGNLVSQAEQLRRLGSVETPIAADPSDVEAALESSDASSAPTLPSTDKTGELDPPPAGTSDSSTNLPAH